jgi:hypothetical protein
MLRRATALLLPLLLLAAPLARAQSGGGASPDIRSFSANALMGFGFDDPITGNETKSERMFTLTLEGFTTFPFGDSFFFTDLTSGDFVGTDDGTDYRAYLEWQPRLSLSKIFQTRVGAGPVSDVLIAAEHNRGGLGFMANLVGLGLALRVPYVPVLNLHLYYRNDNFNPATFQVTTSWLVPFGTGPLRWSFTGFVDVFRDPDYGADIMLQPELLLDVGSLWGKPGNVQLGGEWYLHRSFDGWHTAPQAMARFVY